MKEKIKRLQSRMKHGKIVSHTHNSITIRPDVPGGKMSLPLTENVVMDCAKYVPNAGKRYKGGPPWNSQDKP